MTVAIEELYIYPIKSLGSVPVSRLEFSASGVKNDRRYMLVNSKNKFVSQRSHSILSQFSLRAHADGWQVFSPRKTNCVVPDKPSSDRTIKTEVWGTPLLCRETDAAVSKWFSEQLNERVFLVEFDELQQRLATSTSYSSPLAFADGYPLLICNRQSLIELNSNLDIDLSILRFRPNVVYSSVPNSEYDIKGLRIESGGELYFSKPCVRCNVPAIDPETSVYQRAIHNKLKALLLRDNRVIFGMNAMPEGIASLGLNEKAVEIN